MHEKMTPEELAEAKRDTQADSDNETLARWKRWVSRCLAHIAALEAENERLKKDGKADTRAMLAALHVLTDDDTETLADAARRVVAERAAERSIMREYHTRWTETDRRLAAIRQRAGDTEALGKVAAGPRWDSLSDWAKGRFIDDAGAVARYVVGEDATGAQEPASPEFSTGPVDVTWEGSVNPDGDRDDPSDRPEHSEPSTAEAFATVTLGIGGYAQSDEDRQREQDALSALSLLERRMGAMGRALLGCRAMLRCTEGCTCDVCAALTDAPRVFTLEEVEAEMQRAGISGQQYDAVVTWLTALRKG